VYVLRLGKRILVGLCSVYASRPAKNFFVSRSERLPYRFKMRTPEKQPPVEADLLCLAMSFSDCDRPKSNAARSVHVWCAVVPDLHDNLILTDDAFQRLTDCSVNVSHVVDDNTDDDDVSDDHNDNVVAVDDDVVNDGVNDNENVDDDDVLTTERDDNNDLSLALSSEVAKEQRDDKSLIGCWKLAERGRGGFVVKDNLLYHRAKILGQPFLQLVVPCCRREHVLKMGHDTFGGHMSVKRTKARIYYTFYWPSLAEDYRRYIQTCRTCQMKARVTYRDRVPNTEGR